MEIETQSKNGGRPALIRIHSNSKDDEEVLMCLSRSGTVLRYNGRPYKIAAGLSLVENIHGFRSYFAVEVQRDEPKPAGLEKFREKLKGFDWHYHPESIQLLAQATIRILDELSRLKKEAN